MTPKEQAEFDDLKRQLADAKGRIKAVELDAHETKRAAKLAQEQAEAVRAETDQALLTGADQMRVAHAISLGIFGLTRVGQALMQRKTGSARAQHREMAHLEVLQNVLDAVDRKDTEALALLTSRGRQLIATVASDIESHRVKAVEAAIAYGIRDFYDTFDKLIKSTENK